MTSGDLVYANNACAAFLAAIVQSFERHHPHAYLGRTAVQKLTYFSKVVGVPIPCSFNIYTYGPYSDAVTFSMDSLIADEVVVDQSAKPDYSNYRLGPNAQLLLSEFQSELRPHADAIDRVVKALGEFKPKDLELIATIHFIAKRQYQIGRRAPEKNDVIREFKDVKGDKFRYEDISNWYDALRKAQLI